MVQDLNDVIEMIVKDELKKKIGASIYGSSLFYDDTTNYDEEPYQIGGLMTAGRRKSNKMGGLMLADGAYKKKMHKKSAHGGDLLGDFWTGFKMPFQAAWDNKDSILAAAKLVGLGKPKRKVHRMGGAMNKGLTKYQKILDKVRAQYPNKSFRECQQIAKEQYRK